jgi:DMSO/TMAO reductase YedYZ molybdopterin-dependent catalytic subunit
MNWGPVKTYGDTVPNDRFYVHNRTRPPKVDVGAWRLEVTGNAVAHPRSFTYDELLALPQVTLRRVLDCGANCRAFFPKLPRGGNGPRWLPIGFTQWHFGAVGAADWTGVRLSDVLAATGIDRAIGVKFTGLDSIPVERNEIPLRASHSGRQGPRERHAPGPPHERGRASNRSRLPGARESSRAGEATRP